MYIFVSEICSSVYLSAQNTLCVCVFVRGDLDMQQHLETWCGPVFWFLLKTVTGPQCSINDYDKRATPSGALVHDPFPKYLCSMT